MNACAKPRCHVPLESIPYSNRNSIMASRADCVGHANRKWTIVANFKAK